MNFINFSRLVVAVAESEFNIQINIDSIGLDGGDRKHLITDKIVGKKLVFHNKNIILKIMLYFRTRYLEVRFSVFWICEITS